MIRRLSMWPSGSGSGVPDPAQPHGSPALRFMITLIPHRHRVRPEPGTPSPKDMEDGIKSLNLPVEFLNPEVGREYTFTK